MFSYNRISSNKLIQLLFVCLTGCQSATESTGPRNSFDDLFYGTYVDASVTWSTLYLSPSFGRGSDVCCKESTWLLLNKDGSFEMRIDASVKASQRGTETDTVYSNYLKGTLAGDWGKYGYWAGSVLFSVTGIQTWEAGIHVVDRACEVSTVLVYDLKQLDSSTLHVTGWRRIRYQNCI